MLLLLKKRAPAKQLPSYTHEYYVLTKRWVIHTGSDQPREHPALSIADHVVPTSIFLTYRDTARPRGRPCRVLGVRLRPTAIENPAIPIVVVCLSLNENG